MNTATTLPESPSGKDSPQSFSKAKVVVATSVLLHFISFWRAAAIVLNDLGSSAFYAGGIAEAAIGSSAPWFILGVMLFSYAVRSVYVESCAMFTRGGVYRVVKEAMGGTLAKVSVSALMFDYILTGPISAVSAGQYCVGLLTHLLSYTNHPWSPGKETINLISAGIAVLVTLYFWRRNTRGIQESSDDALKIMYVVTAMIVIMISWSGLTILMKPSAQRLPPSPAPHHLIYNADALGWMTQIAPDKFVPVENPSPAPSPPASAVKAEPQHYRLVSHPGRLFGLIGILIAFGHAILAMSGEESLAQVNRELEYPKHKNLMRAGLVIFVYSLLFTSLVSFFAYAIIPDSVRGQYSDNLISGIAVYLVGPPGLKLAFQTFIVIVGSLMLSGAVNTAIIGSNGVLNRLSEDGVMTDWFRAPHPKFGTTYRMINMIVGLQLLTIIFSRGNVYILGEAYAFGVIWSFAFNALAMLILRFKNKSQREWKVPLNLKINHIEIPIGLGIIALFMFLIATVNLLTKQIATLSGVAFTLIFYLIFRVSERVNASKRKNADHLELDRFQITPKETISAPSLSIRPGNVLCLVRDYQTLEHVRYALDLVDTNKRDLVVMTIRRLSGPDTGYEHLNEEDLFTDYERLLFSRVVSLAEKSGKHVELLVVPSSNIFQAFALTAVQLNSSAVIAGRSSVMPPEAQARQVGLAFETISAGQNPSKPILFMVIDSHGSKWEFFIGAHAPELQEEDIQLIHRLWLDITREPGNEDIHHHDIVSFALAHLQKDLSSTQRKELLDHLRHEEAS